MPTPGHVKAAFQHLRDLANKTDKHMRMQHRGPPLVAGSHVTAPGSPEGLAASEPGYESESCPDCESGVCEDHGTGMEELKSLHAGHAGHVAPKPHGHDDGGTEQIHSPTGKGSVHADSAHYPEGSVPEEAGESPAQEAAEQRMMKKKRKPGY